MRRPPRRRMLLPVNHAGATEGPEKQEIVMKKRLSTAAVLIATVTAFALPATSQASLPTGGKCTSHTSTGTGTQGAVSVRCTYTWGGKTHTNSGTSLP